MNTTNTCNHTEEIARAIYSQHHNQLHPDIPADWNGLPEQEKQAWRKVAGNILPTLGQHALSDPGLCQKENRRILYGEKILWGLVSAALLAALSWLASLGLTGCGHSVDLSRDGAFICKDGACLIIKDGACLIIKDGRVLFLPMQETESEQKEQGALILPQK